MKKIYYVKCLKFKRLMFARFINDEIKLIDGDFLNDVCQ